MNHLHDESSSLKTNMELSRTFRPGTKKQERYFINGVRVSKDKYNFAKFDRKMDCFWMQVKKSGLCRCGFTVRQ